MKHYNSIPRIQDDGTLKGDEVWAFNKLDGQNFCAKFSVKNKEFGPFGSRRKLVDETDDQFGKTVEFFKNSGIPDELKKIVKENSGKGKLFNGASEITFFFEWYGDNSFAGFHVDGDRMHLALIDVDIKKKGYIEPKDFYELFGNNPVIEIPELIYKGKLTDEFINEIKNNDWTKDGCKYPTVKEGVVCRRSTILRGQKMPKVKFKTVWWLTELHKKYDEEKCKELE